MNMSLSPVNRQITFPCSPPSSPLIQPSPADWHFLLSPLTNCAQLDPTLLSQTAFALRQQLDEGQRLRENGAEEREKGIRGNATKTTETNKRTAGKAGKVEDHLIWVRVKLLVKLGLVNDRRLPVWLARMGASLLLPDGECRPPRLEALSTLAGRLEWLCLALGAQSLPPVCSLPPAFLLHPSADCPGPPPAVGPPLFQTCAQSAARVDLAGGWTDTPPITYQMPTGCPPAVLSMSILVNGRRPLRCRCSRLQYFQGIFYKDLNSQSPSLHFASADQVFANCSHPSQPGSLICSILVLAGFVRERLWGGGRHRTFHFGGGRGLFLETESDLPHGSGLGSSSILAAAVFAALCKLRDGRVPADRELVEVVLRVEQLHSTGGGWQDQLGGCVPGGAKLGWVSPAQPRQCLWRPVPLGAQFLAELASRLVLVYTGQTRLAKGLLQEVLLSWSRGNTLILETVKGLAEGARQAEREMLAGRFPVDQCSAYNRLKGLFTPQTEPGRVAQLREQLESQGVAEVCWMAGAGGGGFLYVWLAQGVAVGRLEHILANDPRWSGMNVWRTRPEVDRPLVVE